MTYLHENLLMCCTGLVFTQHRCLFFKKILFFILQFQISRIVLTISVAKNLCTFTFKAYGQNTSDAKKQKYFYTHLGFLTTSGAWMSLGITMDLQTTEMYSSGENGRFGKGDSLALRLPFLSPSFPDPTPKSPVILQPKVGNAMTHTTSLSGM